MTWSSRRKSAREIPIVVSRCAEAGKSLHHAVGVLRSRVDPDVEVSGGSRNAVNGHRMRSDNEKPRAGLAQSLEQVTEVLVHGAISGAGAQATAAWRRGSRDARRPAAVFRRATRLRQ